MESLKSCIKECKRKAKAENLYEVRRVVDTLTDNDTKRKM